MFDVKESQHSDGRIIRRFDFSNMGYIEYVGNTLVFMHRYNTLNDMGWKLFINYCNKKVNENV